MKKKKILKPMTKKERIEAVILGEHVDRIPYSLWSHLPGIDLDPVANAEHTYDFYKTYDVDILKTMNNGMYGVEDYGVKVDYSEIEKGGVAKSVDTPVKTPEDWEKSHLSPSMKAPWPASRNTCVSSLIRHREKSPSYSPSSARSPQHPSFALT